MAPKIQSLPTPIITTIRANSKRTDSPRSTSLEQAARNKTNISSPDLIDATNMHSLTPKVAKDKSVKTKPLDTREGEIERFFDFDKDLDIPQQPYSLGEGHLLNSATYDEILAWNIEEKLTNPFSKNTANDTASNQEHKKQRSLWRESLNGIRKKLPKLFH